MAKDYGFNLAIRVALMTKIGVFEYGSIKRVHFGAAFEDALLDEVTRLRAERVFLIVSTSLRKKTDEISKACDALATRVVDVFDSVPPHTPRDVVIAAADRARRYGADLICTIGGGSVTEAGKGLRVCLAYDITDLDQLDALHLRARPDGTIYNPITRAPNIRQIAVPTTLSGGEFNKAGGLVHPKTRVKHAFEHPDLLPFSVILDPSLTLHTPLDLWLSTGIRALDHAVEALLSKNLDPYSEAASIQALKVLTEGLPRTKSDPSDKTSRQASQSGVWLSSTPIIAGVRMGASHAIGRALGGTAGVPHGLTSCVLLPSVLRYNEIATAAQQSVVAKAMGRAGIPAAQIVEDLVGQLGLPRTLGEVGVKKDKFEAIAKAAMQDRGIYGNPRPIKGWEDIVAILELAA
jgi:maleylacetate reductase